MKLKKNMTIKGLFMLLIAIATMTSCSKYKDYENYEVIENTYVGEVLINSKDSDPSADFTGKGDSGTYSFAWENSEKKASLVFDITSDAGSVQMILNDKKGNEVLNQTLKGDSDIDTYSGVSEKGKSGTWKVTLVFTNFNGDGSFSIHPNE